MTWLQQRLQGLPRSLLAVAGTLLFAAAAVAGGLWWGRGEPDPRPAATDTFAEAPECATIGADAGALDMAVPSATLDLAERGPLEGGRWSSCAWSSIGAPDGPAPRFLQIDFHVYFTGRTGEPIGADVAADRLAEVLPDESSAVAAVARSLGEEGAVRQAAVGSGAEVAFRRDNLVVRLWYGGLEESTGGELPHDSARETALEVAESVAEIL